MIRTYALTFALALLAAGCKGSLQDDDDVTCTDDDDVSCDDDTGDDDTGDDDTDDPPLANETYGGSVEMRLSGLDGGDPIFDGRYVEAAGASWVEFEWYDSESPNDGPGFVLEWDDVVGRYKMRSGEGAADWDLESLHLRVEVVGYHGEGTYPDAGSTVSVDFHWKGDEDHATGIQPRIDIEVESGCEVTVLPDPLVAALTCTGVPGTWHDEAEPSGSYDLVASWVGDGSTD